MSKVNVLGLIVAFLTINLSPISAQVNEPELTGEAIFLDESNSIISLDKEIATHVSGISWTSNSWNAKSLEIPEKQSKTRFKTNDELTFVVRATENKSDPNSVISIYKLKSKKDKRSIVLSEDNSGTLMKSGDNTKDLVEFQGEAYGKSSYKIKVQNLKKGEYVIIVANPNQENDETTDVSCFGIDK